MILGKKDIIIIILCIALAVVGYIAYTPPKPIDSYEKFFQAEVKRLNELNQKAFLIIEERDKKIGIFTGKIDSLQNLKPKIHIEYVSKYKEIDDANANSVANDFKRIFANANIK
jgi:hypothetical protein